MDDVDKAYIAGLFDGEGSIYYKKVKEVTGADKVKSGGKTY